MISQGPLKVISPSKRRIVKEYAAKFVEIVAVEADRRDQVSSFKARLQLFDLLSPFPQAICSALFPLAKRYFSLPLQHQVALLTDFDAAAVLY